MKAITVILSLCLCTGIMQAQKMDSRSFVKQYSGEKGYSAVTINKAALKILSLVAKATSGAAKEEIAFFSRIDGIQMLSCPAKKDKADTFEGVILGFCETNGYESILKCEESGEIAHIYCSLKDDAVTGFTIWSRKGSKVNVLFLNGRFTAEDIKNVMDKKGKNLGL